VPFSDNDDEFFKYTTLVVLASSVFPVIGAVCLMARQGKGKKSIRGEYQ
jgi:hypothetical protein